MSNLKGLEFYSAFKDTYGGVANSIIYTEKYNKIPNTYFYDFMGVINLRNISKKFPVLSCNISIYDSTGEDEVYQYTNGISSLFLDIGEEAMAKISSNNYTSNICDVVIYSNKGYEDEIIRNFIGYIRENLIQHKIVTSRQISLIQKTQEGFKLKSFKIPEIELDLKVNYNDGFIEVHDKIIDFLKSKDKGLVLLHGSPGTGKTTYLRYLINNSTKKVLYIPPDMVHVLSDPNFVGFMGDNTNTVLVIEDAENILCKRSAGNNQSISNILNLSDGLLSDCFKVQVICTFNTNLKDLDSALLRKGRLICDWEFKPLTKDKVENLAKSLGIEYKSEGTLAEIYNYEDKTFLKEKQRIGFQTESLIT